MALFKIFKGSSTALGATSATSAANEGFAYFTPDDGKFYIDIADATTATVGVNRIPLNAYKADLAATSLYADHAASSAWSRYAASAGFTQFASSANWANYSGTANQAVKVYQTASNSTAADYRILLSTSAADTAETGSLNKSTNLRYNPSANKLSTVNMDLTGELNVTGDAYLRNQSYIDNTQAGTLTVTGPTTLNTVSVANRASFAKGFNTLLVGSGTTAQDKGSGVSPRYFPAKWTFNAGVTVADGDVFVIKIPCAGHGYGVFMSLDNGTNYYPVINSGTGRVTTHYPNGDYLMVVFQSNASAASITPVAGADSANGSTVSGGAFRVLNYYTNGYNFSGTTFYSGNSGSAEHNANNMKYNGHYYYSSNGPATTLGAQSTDGAIYEQAYSTNWAGQIAQDYRDGQLFVRGLNSGTWQSWYAIPKFTTTTGGLGSATQPVYIDTSGNLTACTTYANASVNYATSAGKATNDSDGNAINSTYIKKSVGTTKGDILYWSAASTPARLGIGTGGQLLKVNNSNTPVWSASPFHTALTSKGTTATTTAGETYGVVGVGTGKTTTIYSKWFVNLDSGVTVPFNGMMIQIKIPVAGVNAGCSITIDNGANFYPVSMNANGRVTTHFGVNDTITLQFDSARAVAAYGKQNGESNGNATVNITGCWRLMNEYDSGNTNTLLRVWSSATNLDVPLIGQSSANSTNAAWTSYTGTYKDWYGAIPNDDTLRAKINLSTGIIQAPGGIITSSITADQSINASAGIFNSVSSGRVRANKIEPQSSSAAAYLGEIWNGWDVLYLDDDGSIQINSSFFLYSGLEEQSQWFKITIPHNAKYDTGTAGGYQQGYFEYSFDLHTGGTSTVLSSAADPAIGVAHIKFLCHVSSGTWTITRIEALMEGCDMNRLNIYYRLAEPGVFYVYNNTNVTTGQSSIWVTDFYCGGSGTASDKDQIQIETCDAITSSTTPALSDYTLVPTFKIYVASDSSGKGVITKGLLPSSTNTIDLGEDLKRWNKIYGRSFYASGQLLVTSTYDSPYSNYATTASAAIYGGLSVRKQISAKQIRIDNNSNTKGVQLIYDETAEVLNFVFS